jgi:hypothetical protein
MALPYTTQIDGTSVTSSSTVDNGGVVRHGGTIPSDRKLTSKDLGATLGQNVGSKLADTSDTDKSVSAADFGINPGTAQFKLVGNVNYDSTTLDSSTGRKDRGGFTAAGQANKAMRGGAGYPDARGISKRDTITTVKTASAIREGHWVAFGIPGKTTNWNVDPTGDVSGMHDISTGTSAVQGADNAANGIGAPDQNGGTLTIHSGRLGKPTNTLSVMGNDSRMVYKAKHGTTS